MRQSRGQGARLSLRCRGWGREGRVRAPEALEDRESGRGLKREAVQREALGSYSSWSAVSLRRFPKPKVLMLLKLHTNYIGMAFKKIIFEYF